MVVCQELDANDLHNGLADATAIPSSLASLKSRLFYPVWYRLTQVVLALSPTISAYRCKKERSVAFKIHQNGFPVRVPTPTPLGELTTLPRPLVGWGGDTILPASALPLKVGAFGTSVWRGDMPRNIFL